MHIIQKFLHYTKHMIKKMFSWRYTKYTRKLLSVSLKGSVKRRTEGTETELKNENGYVIAPRHRTWAQARAHSK